MVMRLARRLALIFTDCFVQLSPLNLCHVDLLHEETPCSIPENCGSVPTGWTKGTGSPGYLPPGAGCDGQTAVRLRQAVWSCSLGGDAGHYGDLVTLLPPHLDLLGDRSLALFFSLYPLN